MLNLTKRTLAVKPHMLLAPTQRFFGKPGPPGQEPTKIPDKRGQTVLQKMVEDGHEFVMGPPAVLNKTWNAPRESII